MNIFDNKKLRVFNTHMSRWREFLNPSGFIDKEQVLSNLHLYFDIEKDSIEDIKISTITEIAYVILWSGHKFSDFKIQYGVYGSGPRTHKVICFDIKNVSLEKSDPEYIANEYSASLIFESRNGEEIVINYKYLGQYNCIDYLQKYFDQFEYVDYDESVKYSNSTYGKQYCISLDDLGEYLEFVGKNFYNKSFYKSYKYEKLFEDLNIIDPKWHPEQSTTFFYETTDVKLKEELEEGRRELVKSMNEYSDFEFNQMIEKKDYLSMYEYCYSMYFSKINSLEPLSDDKIFNIVNVIDKLIEIQYPMAFIFKAILHLDGFLVLKDYEESKRLLKIAYSLGRERPSLMIWNENNFQ